MTTLNRTLGEIARDLPGATGIFHQHKLDFCCGGDITLEAAAAKRGVDGAMIAASLDALRERSQAADSLAGAPNEELIEHILNRFHDVHREQLPELIRLAQRVERVHGNRPDCPAGLAAQLENMLAELESHMAKEEQILFPMIARGMAGMAAAPVAVMRHEHDDHGAALEGVLALTNDITLPADACNTWRALYLGLATFRDDLMEHIHLENNVLFNRIDGRMGGADRG